MRRRADGPAFEREFRAAVKERYYIKRLPTLVSQYAGAGQPADFYVVGSRFNYAEVKETTDDSFAITGMQQFEEMKDFVKARQMYNDIEMEYFVIVHFLRHKLIVAVTVDQALELSAERKRLWYNSYPKEAFVASTLEELVEKIKF